MRIENLGIPSSGFEYQNLSEGQDMIEEFLKTKSFLKQVFLNDLYQVAPELNSNELTLQFINYGDTQLVYVFQSENQLYTVLVGQPAMKIGTVKKEYDNLRLLALENPDIIVKPEYYFSNGERELYITPYIMQARCIASQNSGWGIYVPEPYYHFQLFNPEEQMYVNTSIIANLIKLYNEKENLGVGSCKIGGGDFILEKDWSTENKTLENTLKRMKLIAARAYSNFVRKLYRFIKARVFS